MTPGEPGVYLFYTHYRGHHLRVLDKIQRNRALILQAAFIGVRVVAGGADDYVVKDVYVE